MKLGIIGCGRFAERRVLPAAKECGISIVALSRRNREEAKRIAKEWGVAHVCSNARELVSHVDAVWITSPHDCHEEDALVCAEAKTPTLIEKPMALTVESAERIEAAFLTTPLLIGHYLRFKWSVQKARIMIENHELGELQHLRASYSIPQDRSNWRHGCGGALQDLGIHLIDLARYLVAADVESVDLKDEGKTAHLFLRFQSGVTAALCCSFVYAFHSSFEVLGTKGRLLSENSLRQTYDPVERLIHFREDDSAVVFPLRAENPYAKQLNHFHDMCMNGASSLIPAQEGVFNARVIG